MLIDDQASQLRRLMRQSRKARTLCVTSGKGGVGKSNVALNLSILLSTAGNRVALVDADLGLANLDVLIDLDIRANLSHVIGGTKSLEEIVVDLPSGVQLVPGASGLAKVAHLSEFQRAKLVKDLAILEEQNDLIIVDTGAGIGPDVLHFASAADHTLVVTAPEPTAITDAYATIKCLHQLNYGGDISLLVNMVGDRHEGRDTYQRIANVARQFLGVRVLDGGYVIRDEKVREAIRRRKPFVLEYPKCLATRCLVALATKLFSSTNVFDQKESFFGKVANWFT